MRETTPARRQFLQRMAAISTGGFLAATARADEPPAVSHPRATSGDDRVEPKWSESLTVTVGPIDADLVGSTQRVIQAAVDYVSGLGGGTVQLLPGTFRFRNAVHLRSNVRLRGSGAESICIKEPSAKVKLAVDSDWYDQEITVENAGEFRVGDGVCLRTRNPHNGGTEIVKRTLVARDGNRFKLDRALRSNFWLLGDTTVSTLFPLITGEEIAQAAIENFVLDGNRDNNDNLDGNYAGCIFLQDCRRLKIQDVTARNFNGDGISWQICHDVHVEDCVSHGHAGLGLHPGSGSQRPVMRRNRLENNQIGIFFCWGVKYGLAEENTLIGNRCGISIGHRDTDNLIVANSIRDSLEVGVLFRPERGKAFAPHRNRLERNVLVDNGPATDGAVMDVQGETEGVTIRENAIEDHRDAVKKVGIRLGPATRDIQLVNNKISGLGISVDDQRQTP